MCNTIKATFTRKYARWDDYADKYVDETTKVEEKLINMEIIFRNAKPILRFIGGPTGHESYYIEDMLKYPPKNPAETLCICAGTVNSWAECVVPWQDVKNFLSACGYKSKPADK